MRKFLASSIVVALGGAGLPPEPVHASATAHVSAANVTTQLPRNVRPTHYDVALVTNADALSYKAEAGIDIEALQVTDRITLHALDIEFDKVSLLSNGGKPIAPVRVSVDAATQTATFEFAQPIALGKHRLAMNYRGKIGTQANGLFAIDYDTPAGKRRALFTQFEASDARRMLPSWDEPNFKATFTLSATVPSAQLAVSNMPVTSRADLGNGLARVSFAQSPKMSTYLLFFSLGDFERATAREGATEVGVVTQRGKLSQAAFALAQSQTILREFNDYFATPYPLPKLDNIASPGGSQFFGAMENWGAIFSFEYILLVDPTISTDADRHRVFQVAAHEIAHQWFGNLVTMQWWDDLWLNEGFASWMESRTTEKLHPEWNTALDAVAGREGAMQLDAVASTHPVVQHVETVEQTAQAFDSITYRKGEAVINMLEDYVGEQAWRDGVRAYMKRYAYANTTSDDLWRAVQTTAGTPVMDIAHDFTLQPGIPLIRVGAPICRDGRTTLPLQQDEFTVDRANKQALSWRVPVTATVVGGTPAKSLLSGGAATLELPGCGPVVVNAGQAGYYRTLYSPAHFAQLRENFAALAPIDQLGVLSDSWELGLASYQPSTDALDLIETTPVEASTHLWERVASVFTALNALYIGKPVRRQALARYAGTRLSPVLANIGWIPRAGEPDTVAILRGKLIDTLGEFGDPAVIAEARRRYDAYATDPNALPGALRKTVLGVVARNADATMWESMRAAARSETTPLVKDQLYLFLASTKDEALARRALELAITSEPGATNAAKMIAAVSGRHPDLAFDFALANMDAVNERVDGPSRSRFYPDLAQSSATPAMLAKLKAYGEAHLPAGARRRVDTAVGNIQYRIKVRAERLPAIGAWLAKRAVGE